jgi:hypothetical protein
MMLPDSILQQSSGLSVPREVIIGGHRPLRYVYYLLIIVHCTSILYHTGKSWIVKEPKQTTSGCMQRGKQKKPVQI